MSLYAKVNMHDKSAEMLSQAIPAPAVYSTDVYQKQMAHVDEQVAHIILWRTIGSDGVLSSFECLHIILAILWG